MGKETIFQKQQELISFIPNGMHTCVLSGKIHLEYASDGLCKMLGYTREELETLTDGNYTKLLVEEDRPSFAAFVRELAKKPQKLTIEYRFIKKDGSIIYAADTMESILGEDGTMKGYSSVTDVTAFKEKERQLHRELKEASSRDPMTRLYNKVAAYERINRILEKKAEKEHAMLVCDLDNFKRINDFYGHAVGDNVLLKVAELLKAVFSKRDILSRFGGDEFIVFISEVTSSEEVQKKAQQFITSFRDYADMDYSQASLSVSVGIAFFHGCKNAEELFLKADRALYMAKENQKNQYFLFQE